MNRLNLRKIAEKSSKFSMIGSGGKTKSVSEFFIDLHDQRLQRQKDNLVNEIISIVGAFAERVIQKYMPFIYDPKTGTFLWGATKNIAFTWGNTNSLFQLWNEESHVGPSGHHAEFLYEAGMLAGRIFADTLAGTMVLHADKDAGDVVYVPADTRTMLEVFASFDSESGWWEKGPVVEESTDDGDSYDITLSGHFFTEMPPFDDARTPDYFLCNIGYFRGYLHSLANRFVALLGDISPGDPLSVSRFRRVFEVREREADRQSRKIVLTIEFQSSAESEKLQALYSTLEQMELAVEEKRLKDFVAGGERYFEEFAKKQTDMDSPANTPGAKFPADLHAHSDFRKSRINLARKVFEGIRTAPETEPRILARADYLLDRLFVQLCLLESDYVRLFRKLAK